ncbi:MAG: phosphoribosylglycinamide formyltransferase [Gammaproteobacteria bacterium]
MEQPVRMAVFASHTGTTLQAVLDATAIQQIHARVCLVLSNNSQSMALERARLAGIQAAHISVLQSGSEQQHDENIYNLLQKQRIELVLLAGYMKKLSPSLIAAYPNRILNTHPSLLPKFSGRGMYGTRVHRAVIQAKEAYTGATLHVVNAAYDQGPILDQEKLPVTTDNADTLAQEVQRVEKGMLIKNLRRICADLTCLDRPPGPRSDTH